MRRAGARAAAAFLALALGVAGCTLVDSLTPFGIGTKDYSSEGANLNGLWAGKTATGGNVTFQVGSNAMSGIVIVHVSAGCSLTFEDQAISVPIIDGAFAFELPLEGQGSFTAGGVFTSAGTCSGTYRFEALPASGFCPSAGSSTFTAEKLP